MSLWCRECRFRLSSYLFLIRYERRFDVAQANRQLLIRLHGFSQFGTFDIECTPRPNSLSRISIWRRNTTARLDTKLCIFGRFERRPKRRVVERLATTRPVTPDASEPLKDPPRRLPQPPAS